MALKALEFFAGIGLARIGLERSGVDVVWANDYDKNKQEMYEGHFGRGEYLLADVHSLDAAAIPNSDIAWSSSPCTDLSLAGTRTGLTNGRESSAFFGFTKALERLQGRRPKAVVLENVPGLASSHGGDDLRAAAHAFNELGYSVDAVALDARRWVPQSRQRMFMVGIMEPSSLGTLDSPFRPEWLSWLHSDKSIRTHVTPLPDAQPPLTGGLTLMAEPLDADGLEWWDETRVARFIESMSGVQRDRIEVLKHSDVFVARTAYRRTRGGVPTWEMRADDVSGCLRTARGGSSKQAIAFVGQGEVRVRWMTGREYSRLMGAGEYTLDNLRESQILYGFGDAVAVPAVQWVISNMVIPELEGMSGSVSCEVSTNL